VASISKISMLLFLFIVLAYSAIITYYKPTWKVDRTLWQKNVVSAEEFVFDKKPTIVLTGTSLGSTMHNDFFPANFYNLSFYGLSVFEGMEIALHKPGVIKYILVEINHFERSPSQKISEKVNSPYSAYIKRYIPMLQEKYNPYNAYIIPGIAAISKKIAGKKSETPDTTDAVKTMTPFENHIFESKLQITISEFENYPDTATLKANILLLKQYESKFKLSGIRFVFYETPMHQMLINSKLATTNRAMLKRFFSPQTYLYLSDTETSKYMTVDGKHLDKKSGRLFSEYIIKKMDSVLKNQY
jgi:hypothetical protein